MHKPLAALLTQERIITDLRAADRWQAIDELLGNLIESHAVDPAKRAAIAAVVRKREQSMSTGIGYGIGIPPPLRIAFLRPSPPSTAQPEASPSMPSTASRSAS